MIGIADIAHAREQIADTIHQTPLLTSKQLSLLCGNEMYLKAEHLQKTGSFKIRGATHKVKQAVREGAVSVTAASSGNHGQAVAYIASKLGIGATIVVPEDVAACKLEAIQAYQGEVEKCGLTSAERLPRAMELAKQQNGVYIPPYDDPYIMAGQGTVGLEILEQLDDVDAVFVPIGGGGLISGVLTAIKETKPSVQVIGVEPQLANDTYLSLKQNQRISIAGSTTIADGLRTSEPGELTFPVLRKYIDDVVLVTEEEIRQAFCFVLERMKQVIEPSSATVIAAAMFEKTALRNKRIVTLVSGGNVDLDQLAGLVSKSD
ncbi:threonine ammonia-lyase [Brevibacillus choshinensis]|uniref:Threonine/serine dehydratase n=1 Tax=Brevibacillus choshinensis TaxID=54911 RepID=A0ABX7FMX9_BRECH|nr:threonine/serine dehydratase [Brevibacillus choshinensis]QRG66651.1 threonine/serine dehydratase [Brevibacillus choshinensis]